MFSQLVVSTQFFLFGKRSFTARGWERHCRRYEQPDILKQTLDLSRRVFMVSGANSGIGKEVTRFLASKGGTVYMVCRSRAKAEEIREQIARETGNAKVHLLVGDMSLEADVRRCWKEFIEHAGPRPRLDALVCNAGALSHERTLTSEGIETTFACHLLFGTYLLGSLAIPTLQATEGSRLVAVSSGGMYNFPFPSWEVATATDAKTSYDGQFAYGYAKRGQVLLCEEWAARHPDVTFVSCHPGWTSTPGVDAAYGSSQKWLQPLRTLWQGAEGIIWLCVAPRDKLSSGDFYLDRAPQTKHIAGFFCREGSFTKNSRQEINAMMAKLKDWSEGRRPRTQAAMIADSPAAGS
mmetsp:Transcript_17333/g.40397  ORF Transcript_17333/g.40397 Transcript_17333/m.40397 type:complete len:351 (-) Transcript_17333:131-1183(-)